MGAWGHEDRDYHIQVEVEPAAVGREKLAARVTVLAGDDPLGEGLVKAIWTADTALSTRISDRVAHYTGQAELAQAVRDGLAARTNGDLVTATAKLHRAMELAVESGNDGTAKLLNGGHRGRRAHRHCEAAARRRRGRRDGTRRAVDPDRTRTEGRLMPTCPDGHATDASDYCSVCGAVQVRTARMPGAARDHGRSVSRAARFGAPGASRSPMPVEWTAVVTADKDYYKRVIARGGPDTVEFPEVFPERRIILQRSTLIGRNNRKQGVEPGIDLGIHPVDRGVSTQHAVLQIRESGLTITDLGSTNGTTVNESDDLLGNGQETPLVDGDRIHVGAWTTITVNRSEKRRT